MLSTYFGAQNKRPEVRMSLAAIHPNRRRLGKSYVQISRCLSKEELATTKVVVYKFVERYEERGIISHSSYDISYIVRKGVSIHIYFYEKYTLMLRASVDREYV